MSLTMITGPVDEPVTEAMLRDHATLDSSVPSALLQMYLKAARASAEFLTGRAILPQTWERTLDEFPVASIPLGRPPVLSVTSVKYYDTDGVQQTVDPANYLLDERTEPGYVVPVDGYEWPSTQDRVNAVVVRFQCGYPTAADVREDLKHWIYIRAATAVDNREEVDRSGRLARLSFVDSLLASSAVVDGALWGC
jgi:uncharacterized phiE125 gp8 family phage protein